MVSLGQYICLILKIRFRANGIRSRENGLIIRANVIRFRENGLIFRANEIRSRENGISMFYVFISSVMQFDKSIHPVLLYENYLICIFMNINET